MPTGISVAPSPICSGDSALLAGTCASGTIKWYSDAALTTLVTDLNVAPTATQKYYALCDAGTCVSDTVSVTLTVNPTPSVPTGISVAPSPICSGDSALLAGTCASGTIKWYSDAALTTLVTNLNVAPTATQKYYALCDAGTCVSDTVSVTLTVNPTPSVPSGISVAPSPICSGDSALLAGNCASGTIKWYSDAALTTLVTNLNVTPTATQKYYALCDAGTCVSDTVSVTLTVNPTPSVPTGISVAPSPICSGDSALLAGTCASGTIKWYSNAALTTLVTNLNVAPTATQKYYALCDAGTCVSDTVSVTLTVNPTPSVPTGISVAPSPICSGDSALLAGNCASGTIKWYSNATLTTLVTNLNVTPTATQKYYALCDAGTCVSDTVSVTLTVNPTPSVPTGISVAPSPICSGDSALLAGTCVSGTIKWYSDAALTTLVTNLNVTPKATQKYYALCDAGTCVSDTVSVTLTVNPTPSVPNGISVAPSPICSGDSALLAGTCASGTIKWYSNAALTTLVTNLNVAPTATQKYYALCDAGTCVSDTVSVTLTVKPTPSVPTGISVAPSPICSGDSALLAGTCVSGTIKWYSDATLTTLVTNLNVAPTATQKYYALCDAGTCVSDTVSVTLTVNPTPSVPTGISVAPSPICSGDSALLAGTCASGTIKWYSNAALTTLVTNLNVTPTATQKYYALCDAGTCLSDTVSVTLTVNPTPSVPTGISVAPSPICSGDTALLAGTCASGTIKWYSNAALTTLVTNLNVAPTATQKYYALCDAGTCLSDTVSVTLTVNPTPSVPTGISVAPSPICSGDSALLAGTCASGTIKWYSDATLTTLVTNLNVAPTATQKYYALCDAGTCLSDTVSVTLTVNPTPSVPTGTAITPNVICVGETAVLSGNCGSGTLKWFMNSSLTAPVLNTTVDTINTARYYAICDNGFCISDTISVLLTVNDCENPSLAIVKGSALNLGVDGAASVGDIVTYSYDVTNTGNVTLHGVTATESATAFTGTGTLPTPTFVSATLGSAAGTLLVGEKATYTATYAITQADINAGKIDNQAFADGLSPKNVAVKDTSDSKNPADYNESGVPSDPAGEDKTGTLISENPSIAIVKGSALNLGVDGAASVGDIITYSYDVTNTGNVTLHGVTATESATAFTGTGTLPTPTFVSATLGSSAGTLLVGEKATYTATYAITQADINAGKIDNQAFADGLSPKNVAVKDTSDSKNPADYNESGVPSDPAGEDKTGTLISENPSIAIVKGSALNLGVDGAASVGDIVTYSYDVTNTGNVTLHGVTATESATAFTGTGTLPTPTFVSATLGSAAGTLLVGEKATYTATYAITQADINAGKIDNQAFADGLSPKNVAVKDTSDSKNPADYNESGVFLRILRVKIKPVL